MKAIGKHKITLFFVCLLFSTYLPSLAFSMHQHRSELEEVNKSYKPTLSLNNRDSEVLYAEILKCLPLVPSCIIEKKGD